MKNQNPIRIFNEDCVALAIALRFYLKRRISFRDVQHSLNHALGEVRFDLENRATLNANIAIPKVGRFISDHDIACAARLNIYNMLGGADDFEIFRATERAAWLVSDEGRDYFDDLQLIHQR